MNERLLKLAEQIDARTLRERVAMFLAAAAVVTFGIYRLLLEPVYVKEVEFTQRIKQQQDQIRAADIEMTQRIAQFQQDPDALARQRIAKARAEIEQVAGSLRELQRGMVPPARVLPLLQDLLRRQGKLTVVGLKTLPVTGWSEPPPLSADAVPAKADTTSEAAPAPVPGVTESLGKTAAALGQAVPGAAALASAAGAAAAKPAPPVKVPEILFRHSVEVTLEGAYPDMVAYLAALEGMPTQLLWTRATLDARDPKHARLTLVVSTVSLDRKWIEL